MNDKRLCMLLMWPCFLAAVGRADIPVPDAMVWGQVQVGELPATATDDVTVIARVARLDVPIATYRMGDIPTAGDRYVLRVPYAVQDDGHTPSAKMGRAGELAEIHIKVGSGPEQYVTDVVLPPSGDVKQLNLRETADTVQANRELGDVGVCGTGAAECGAVSLISMWIMFCGLAQMKRTHRRRRRN